MSQHHLAGRAHKGQSAEDNSGSARFQLQLERLFELGREVTDAEKRRAGARLVYLPGDVSNTAVPVRSRAFRAWIAWRYWEVHREEVSEEVLGTFINRASFSSFFPAVTVPRAE